MSFTSQMNHAHLFVLASLNRTKHACTGRCVPITRAWMSMRGTPGKTVGFLEFITCILGLKGAVHSTKCFNWHLVLQYCFCFLSSAHGSRISYSVQVLVGSEPQQVRRGLPNRKILIHFSESWYAVVGWAIHWARPQG